jgi:hypothetical protein
MAALAVTAEVEADAFLSNLADELQALKAPKAIRTESFTQTKTLGELKREEEVRIEPSVSEQMVRRSPRGSLKVRVTSCGCFLLILVFQSN